MRIRLKSIAAILLGFVLAVTMSATVLTAFAGEDTGLSETEVTDALKEKLKDKNTTDDFVIASWVSFYDTKYASTYDQLADPEKDGAYVDSCIRKSVRIFARQTADCRRP